MTSMPCHVHIARRVLAFGLAAFVVTAGARAQSLQELRAQEAEEAALAKEAQYTSSLCQTSISTRIDWRTAANWPDGVSLSTSCDAALGAIEWFCRTPDGRTRVKRITTFVCKGDGTGPSLAGGALSYGAKPGVNGFEATRSYLSEKL
ncbi:MAG: hypothetical protein AAGA09_08660 [Pseudomonadota bacterium]